MDRVSFNNVTKEFKNKAVLKGVSFNIEAGDIYGLIGENGAGKTTLLKLIVNLLKPTSGNIQVLGKEIKKDSYDYLRNIGALIDEPVFYKKLTLYENFKVHCEYLGFYDEEKLENVLIRVGLHNKKDRKIKELSFGEKQKLAIAYALITEPELLILDEPTNGLDPSGIIDFRDVVKKAARERGMAVFISSHILSEVQNLCDRVAFINNGVIKSVEDIHDNSMETELDSLTLVVSSNKEQAVKVLKDIGFVNSSTVIDEEIHIIVETGKTTELLKVLLKNNVLVEEIYKNRKGLEQRYMELVEGGIR